MRVEDQAREGLGVEICRLLGHDVPVCCDRRDRSDRRRLEQERGIGAVYPAVDPGDRFGGRLGVGDCPSGDRVGVDREQALEGDAEQGYIEPAQCRATGREERLERMAARGQERPTASRPKPEPTLAAGRQPDCLEPATYVGDRDIALDDEEFVEPPFSSDETPVPTMVGV